jgi:hypothetical protein
MGLISSFLQKVGVKAAPKPAANTRAASEAQIKQALAQRRQTLSAIGVDPAERLAAAFTAQAAKQRLDREIRDCGGSPQLQDALRRLMADR